MVRINRIAAIVVVQIKKSGFAVIENNHESMTYIHENIDERKYHVYNTGKRIFIIPRFEGNRDCETVEDGIARLICKVFKIKSL